MSDRPFIGARIEDAVHRRLGAVLTRREWKPLLIPFRGYGSQNHIRILARVILAPDRKSTRLNSSHSSISHAVFCLKKNPTM